MNCRPKESTAKQGQTSFNTEKNYSSHTIVPGSSTDSYNTVPQVSQQDSRNIPIWAQFLLEKSKATTQLAVKLRYFHFIFFLYSSNIC